MQENRRLQVHLSIISSYASANHQRGIYKTSLQGLWNTDSKTLHLCPCLRDWERKYRIFIEKKNKKIACKIYASNIRQFHPPSSLIIKTHKMYVQLVYLPYTI